jgi:hypothetical protein
MMSFKLELQARCFAVRLDDDQYRALRGYEAQTRAIPLTDRILRLEGVSEVEIAGPLASALYFRIEDGEDPAKVLQAIDDRFLEIAASDLIQSKLKAT